MPMRILIIEDDRLQSDVLAGALELRGHLVQCVANGADAMWSFVNERFDMVLVDFRMSGMNGVITARTIIDFVDADDLPRLVALTAAPGEVAMQEMRSGHVFDGIVEKSDLESMVTSVESYLRYIPHPSFRYTTSAGTPTLN